MKLVICKDMYDNDNTLYHFCIFRGSSRLWEILTMTETKLELDLEVKEFRLRF